MVRWLKLFGDQYFGFWVLGLVPLAAVGVAFLAVHFLHVYGNLRG